MTLTLQSLARTIAKARHGADAMWANYMGAAEAVAALYEPLVNAATEARDHIRSCHGTDERPDSDSGFIVKDLNDALALIARPDGAQ